MKNNSRNPTHRFHHEWIFFTITSLTLAVMFGYMVYFEHELITTHQQERLTHSTTVAGAIITNQLEKIYIVLEKIRPNQESDGRMIAT